MAFVCEKIREEEREFFETIGFTETLGTPSTADWWAIDRERNIILVSRGGMIGVRYMEYQLYFGGELIKIRATKKMEGNHFNNNLRITWIVEEIEIPRTLVGQKSEIKKIIEEAFTSYGMKGRKDKQVLSIKVEFSMETDII